MEFIADNLFADSTGVELVTGGAGLGDTGRSDEGFGDLAAQGYALVSVLDFSGLTDDVALSIGGHVRSCWARNSDASSVGVVLEVLFTVQFAANTVDEGLGGLANVRNASVLSGDDDDSLVIWAFGDLALSVEESFSLDGTDGADAKISSSDFVLLALDFSAVTIDDSESVVAWLGDASLLFNIEEFGGRASRNAVFSLELVTWLAGNDLAGLSVPVASGGASVNTGGSDGLLGGWAFDLNTLVVLLDESFLALELEASLLLKDESFSTGDSLALVVDHSEVLFALDLVASVVL